MHTLPAMPCGSKIEADNSCPIAIIGIGCRFPDDATNPEKFWELIINKHAARRDVPPERFNVDAFHHPHADRSGTMNNRGGHYLKEDIAAFDAHFFSISPAEAVAIDPMQRMLLEVVYEAIENAGVSMQSLSGTDTSCFVGSFTTDYARMLSKDTETAPKYAASGGAPTLLSNRISYFYNFKGPSMTIDTACSSSLVAVHLACQSIRLGESKTAIVGATNAIFSPDPHIEMSSLHFLSPDSACQTFDEKANGYARGEGIAAILLKPLKDAIRDGDTIRAVIRGSAVNSDGKTAGITLPSKDAQISLIQSAYRQAGCDMSVTGYFEAHGTGTPAGDPLETGAIGATLGKSRPPGEDGKLWVGSVKPNIGHLEGTSGLAGLIKATLSVEKGIIPPNIRFENGNPNINFDAWRIRIPTQCHPWPVAGLRRASVNSFGFGGTNSHVIIDDAYHYLRLRGLDGKHRTTIPSLDLGILGTDPSPLPSAKRPSYFNRLSSDHALGRLSESNRNETSRPDTLSRLSSYEPISLASSNTTISQVTSRKRNLRIFIISANEEKQLKRLISLYADHIACCQNVNENEFLDDLSYTLCQRRSRLPWGAAVVASAKTELVQKLESITTFTRRTVSSPGLSFIFTGQGAQWWAMGRELCNHPIFETSLVACGEALRKFGCDWSIFVELFKSEESSRVHEAMISQPLCTAIQIALVDLLAAWNIQPARVVGHSSGEIAAAYTTGALSLESAMRVAYWRGALASEVKYRAGSGAMMAVGLNEEDARMEISAIGSEHGQVGIACVNSPKSITVSGDDSAVAELQSSLSSRNIFARRLQVDTAYHSHHMLAIARDYHRHLKDLQVIPRESRKPVLMFSSVTEELVTDTDLGADYWVKNMVSSVRFAGALRNLCQDGSIDILVELGPHSALAGPVKQILAAMPQSTVSLIKYMSALVRGKDAEETIVEVAAELFVRGSNVDTIAVQCPDGDKTALSALVDLPTYCWNHDQRYWFESRLSKDYRFRPFPRTDILGARSFDWNPMEPKWRNFIRLHEQPWIRSHIVQGAILYPAAGYCCMALEATAQMHAVSGNTLKNQSLVIKDFKIREMSISRALVVPETDQGVEVCFSMRPASYSSMGSSNTWNEFRVLSCTEDGNWNEHCRGQVTVTYQQSDAEAIMYAGDFDLSLFSQQTHFNPVDCVELYKDLDAVGLTYGPEFQGVINASVGKGKAIGTVKVTDTSAVMPNRYEYPRLIHPATMDAFLQMCICAYGDAEIGRMKQPYVPVLIGEITISSGVSSLAGDEFRAIADTRKHGLREIIAEMKAVQGNSTTPVVQMRDIKCVALTAMASAESKDANTILRHCYTAVWEPDVDLLSREELNGLIRKPFNLPASCMNGMQLLNDQHAGAIGLQQIHQITTYLRILSHKNPNLKLLEIGASTGCLTAHVLEALGSHGEHKYQRLQSYTYTDTSSDAFEKVKEEFVGWTGHIDFKMLDIAKSPSDQDFESGAFDIVLATNVLYARGDMSTTIANARKLLKVGGKLIIVDMIHPVPTISPSQSNLADWLNHKEPWHKEGSLLTESGWEEVLKQNGFSALEASSTDSLHPREETSRLMIASAVKDTNDKLISSSHHVLSTIIIVPDNTAYNIDMILKAVQPAITELGIPVKQSTLRGLDGCDLRNSIILSFAEFNDTVLRDIDEFDYQILQRLIRDSAGVLWITRGGLVRGTTPELSLFEGLARSIRSEQQNLPCTTVDFDAQNISSAQTIAQNVLKLFQRTFLNVDDQEILDHEYVECDGVLQIKRTIQDDRFNRFVAARTKPRALEDEMMDIWQNDRSFKMEVKHVGSLDSLVFDDDPAMDQPLLADQVEVEVRAVGLNFKDVLVSMGEVSEDYIGNECAGIVTKVGKGVQSHQVGDRVAVWHCGCFATSVRTVASCAQKIPDNMPFSVAASLPLVFNTAYYGLIYLARLRAGETVLIHAAAGGVGQAAIQLAQMVHANVFVTVGTDEKKKHIMDTYGIQEDHIFSSRDLSFADGIKFATSGRGVDVVLNSLAGDLLHATWQCIAPFGRFVEIGKKDINSNGRLEMKCFAKNVSFSHIDLSFVLRQNLPLAEEIFSAVMSMVRNKHVHAVYPLTVQPFSQIEHSFRLMQAGKHLGKIVLEAKKGDLVPVVPSPRSYPKLNLRDDATYLLAGGLGGLGRSIARWMVNRGAKNLIFVSRSGATSTSAKDLISDLKSRGTRCEIIRCNVDDSESLSRSLKQALQTMPPLRGVLQGAMVLKDQIFSNMPYNTFMDVIRPKVHGSWAIHQATIDQPLDFFVLMSSIAGCLGNRGQSNYSAACTYQVALAAHRRSLGLCATAIDIGKVLDIGVVAEHAGSMLEKNLEKIGILGIQEDELLAMMELAMAPAERGVANGHLITGLHSTCDVRKDRDVLFWAQSPVFSHLDYLRPHLASDGQAKETALVQQLPLSTTLPAANTAIEAAAFVLDGLSQKLARSLMVPLSNIDSSRPLSEFGLDSLVAVDIRNWIIRDAKAEVPIFAILQATSLSALATQIMQQSSLVQIKIKESG